MLKRFEGVLGFSQHRHTPLMMNLAQYFSRAARATRIPVVWHRAPITTVTLLLILSIWLYDRVAVSSATGSPPPEITFAADAYPPAALVAPIPANLRSTTHIESSGTHSKPRRLPAKASRTRRAAPHSAFREKIVSHDEVDYVAKDVTIRVFTAPPKVKPKQVSNAKRQLKFGKDVTVRYFDDPPTAKPRPVAAATRSGDGSLSVTK